MSYETPSMAIFQNRKRFHAAQKSPSESTSNWFKRLQDSIQGCEFSRVSVYMLIDKFVSGLSETDFETISQVPTWTLDELILLVIGNAHIFESKELRGHRQQQPNENDQQQNDAPPHETSLIKVEPTMRETKENDGEFEDALLQESMVQDRNNEIDLVECSLPKRKRPLTASERKRNYINRIKEAGKFEEYKRKKAEQSARQRLLAKNNEHLLPPELQIHLINQRRQANRDKMKRYRQRTSTKIERPSANVVWLEQYHESGLTTGNYIKIESEVKQESFSGIESDLDLAAVDRLGIDLEYGDVPQPETKPKPKSKTKRKFTSKPVRRSNVVRQKKRRYECYSCALQCDSLLALKTHLKIFHPVERSHLKCYLCDKTTVSLEVLTRHLRKFHCEIPMHKCPCCEEKFERLGGLDQHLKRIHPGYKPFVCEVCGYSSRTKSDLWAHSRTHTGRKDAKCDICGLLFATSSSRNKHMSIHTGVKNHRCKYCGTSFRQPGTLRFHLMWVHEQGKKPVVCEICGKRFISMYRLKLHSNSHTGDRPYTCNYCGNSFTQPSSLKLHVRRTHENSLDTNNGATMTPNEG